MASISRQIGWSQESNLLWQILNQLTKLTSIIFGLKPKYKVYTALLTQTGTDAPVATVLENTLEGEIVWSYLSIGYYIATLNNAFTFDKTWGVITSRFSDDGGASAYDAFLQTKVDSNFIVLSLFNNAGVYADNLISPGSPLAIEIRVYN